MARRLEIENIRHQFDQGARANRFEVNVFGPSALMGATEGDFSMRGIRCVNASLPGRSLEVADFSEYGPTRKMPYQVNHGGEVTMSFLCDSTFADRFIIQAWQETIFSAQGEIEGNAFLPVYEWYNNYIGRVEINQLTRSDKKSLSYTLHEAYPVGFAQQELDSSTTDDIMKFEVTWAYRSFTTEYKNPGQLSGFNRGARALGALNDLLGVFGKSNSKITKFQERLNRLHGTFGPSKTKDKTPNKSVQSSKGGRGGSF